MCREGPRYVLELARFGAEFTRASSGALHLTREGGHSARRIVHAADATGAEIERALVATARAHPNIHFFEHHLAVDLLTEEIGGVRYCLGADVLDQAAGAMARCAACLLGWWLGWRDWVVAWCGTMQLSTRVDGGPLHPLPNPCPAHAAPPSRPPPAALWRL